METVVSLDLGLFGLLDLAMLFFMGGGWAPLGAPPHPEDAALWRTAPRECLVFMYSGGVGKADGASPLRAERYTADPEAMAWMEGLREGLAGSVLGMMEEEQAQRLRQGVPALVRAIAGRPMTLCLSSLAFGEEGPLVEGAMVVHVGEARQELRKAMLLLSETLRQMHGEEGLPQRLGEEEGSLEVLPQESGTQVAWGMVGEHLVVALGMQTPRRVVAALRDPATPRPAWLEEGRRALPVAKLGQLTYVKAPELVKAMNPGMPGSTPEHGDRLIRAAGLDGVSHVLRVVGYDRESCIDQAMVAFVKPVPAGGELPGVLSLFAGRPLVAEDLAQAPAGASFAWVGRVDLERVYRAVMQRMKEADAATGEAAAEEVAEFERVLGARVVDDVLRGLGDTWTVYSHPLRGGPMPVGLIWVVPVRDAAALGRVNEALMKALSPGTPRGPQAAEGAGERVDHHGPEAAGERAGLHDPESAQGHGHRAWGLPVISRREVAGHGVYSLSGGFVPAEIGFDQAPSWCLTKTHLIFGLYPQAVRAHLLAPAGGPTLADEPEVRAALAPGAGVYLTLARGDALTREIYPALLRHWTQHVVEQAEMGRELDQGLFPSAGALTRHMGTELGQVTLTPQGVVMRSRQSLTLGWPAAVQAGLSLAAAEVPISLARAAQVAEFERLREVVAACHNHASNKGEAFPASLEELVKAELLDAEVLAPRRKPLIYLGKGRTTEEENPESKPLIATEPVRGQRCVAYADGQVTLVDEETYQTQLKLLGKPKP